MSDKPPRDIQSNTNTDTVIEQTNELNEKVLDLSADKKFHFWVKLAKDNQNKKNWDKALKCYDEALKIHPKNERLLFNKGIIYFLMGEIDICIKYLQTTLTINSKFEEANTRLGFIFKNKKEYERAKNYFIAALNINPGLEAAREGLAAIYLEEKIHESAEKHYHYLVTYINKKNYVAQNNYAWLLYLKGNYSEAIVHAKLSLKYKKDFQNAFDTLAASYVGEKDYKNAVKSYKKLLKLNPRALKDQLINKKAYEEVKHLLEKN